MSTSQREFHFSPSTLGGSVQYLQRGLTEAPLRFPFLLSLCVIPRVTFKAAVCVFCSPLALWKGILTDFRVMCVWRITFPVQDTWTEELSLGLRSVGSFGRLSATGSSLVLRVAYLRYAAWLHPYLPLPSVLLWILLYIFRNRRSASLQVILINSDSVNTCNFIFSLRVTWIHGLSTPSWPLHPVCLSVSSITA